MLPFGLAFNNAKVNFIFCQQVFDMFCVAVCQLNMNIREFLFELARYFGKTYWATVVLAPNFIDPFTFSFNAARSNSISL